ncbi:hypothetical protein LCGC14_2772870 [marine sediment metagenome]|uniref:Uncharacterized protein n=1 Tax=marine sediment metagenome TaxID=412755 RepID=A0A0F9B4B3_9ZZZZ
MKITVFKKRPYSAMVNVSQDEAWRLVRSLVDQMQKNDPNTERLEMTDVAGQYFSIAVTPDLIRSLTSWDRRALIDGYALLVKHIHDSASAEGKEFLDLVQKAYGKELETALAKLSKLPEE